jgi:hypothetical protein
MAQYDACARALDVELGVRPTEETTLVYEQIKQGLLERSVSGPPLAPWAQPGTAVARPPGPSTLAQPRAWSAIPAPGPCYGRERDLATLVRLVIDEECRVIALVGVGGVGKTTLAAQIADTLGGTVDVVLWHSLASAPRPDVLLGGLIASLTAAPPAIPADMDDQLLQLLRLLRQHRCLLVLDGWEHFLRPGERAGEYLKGYEGYGRLLSYLGTHEHQSCLLLTSRELPWGLDLILAPPARVQTIGVAGLDIQPARQILQAWGITSQVGAAEELIRRCAGNPLALRIIAEAVRDIFGGQLDAFLQEGALIFDHTRALVEQQWLRLSNLEQEILAWLAVRPGALQISDLRQCLASISWVSLIEALRALQRRSLVKQGEAGFVLHPLMVEYIRDQLADQGYQG